MAAFASGFRTLEREVAHAIHPRDNSSATDSVSPSHQSVNVHLSTSVKSLVGVFTVIGVFILGTTFILFN